MNTPFTPIRQLFTKALQQKNSLNLNGINNEQFLLLLPFIQDCLPAKVTFIFENNLEAELAFTQMREKYHFCHFYPGLEFSPYNSIISSERSLLQRINTLISIDTSDKTWIFTTLEALALRMPHPSLLKPHQLKIQVSDILDPYELSNRLANLGFRSAISVEEPGTYSHKGAIFDIYTSTQGPLRIHYYDDMIENIYPIDPDTYTTVRDKPLEAIILTPSPYFVANDEYIDKFNQKISLDIDANNRKLLDIKRKIIEELRRGNLFEDFPKFFSLFFSTTTSLGDLLCDDANHLSLKIFLQADLIKTEFENYLNQLQEDFTNSRSEIGLTALLPSPQSIYSAINKTLPSIEVNEVGLIRELEKNNSIPVPFKNLSTFLQNTQIERTTQRGKLLVDILKKVDEIFQYQGGIIFVSSDQQHLYQLKSRINDLLNQLDVSSSILTKIIFTIAQLKQSFYYTTTHTLILAEEDIFKTTTKAQSRKTNTSDLFAQQLATLSKGDYVIHRDYGVAKYLGLETMTLGDVTSDFLLLEFQQNDKVYLPVYKMNLIQKQAGEDAKLTLASLRNNKFNQIKTKAKQSAKKLAFDLLRLQAERESSQAFSFSPPDDMFFEFERKFPFKMTPDQQVAIDNILDDMLKNRPMDHLVCGDVGFGKTEVAMRAAFKAVEDNKQVAVLVPTTVLALQHFHSFTNRFADFPVRIEFLSRFKSTKESKEIKERLQTGEIDIIIGTHKLLSKDIRYYDLGLVIVDEEQRFGVGHKEKLKLLKKSVDFLTLTATPIPRTLQFAMLGIRDLSLIKTPPPKRQSIKSYLVIDNDQTIKKALQQELSRGGQVFIVHNRVSDIEEYVQRIRDLLPEASITYAHGQMSEKELEKRISAFYSGTYQILISTTIIESGIDIPNANTMIINRADRFGLAQLHQLRGRIGRSDRKAYAYFVIPDHFTLSTVATQRLKALQTYNEIGSGFNIANVDLEIRGAGDLLGAEQSGHLNQVGLELYMELLQETIRELKGETTQQLFDIEIQTPFASFIPQSYITDDAERLRFYKKLSNAQTIEELQTITNSLVDIFGVLPTEVEELETILAVRIKLNTTPLQKIKVAGKVISLEFDQNRLNQNEPLRNKIIDFFLSQPQKYTFTPQYKVIYQHSDKVSISILREFSDHLAQELR